MEMNVFVSVYIVTIFFEFVKGLFKLYGIYQDLAPDNKKTSTESTQLKPVKPEAWLLKV